MKNIIIVITIIILLLIGVVCFYLLRDYEVTSFKSMHYSSSSWGSIYDTVRYDIVCDKKCSATVKPAGMADEDAKTFDLDKRTVNKIVKIFDKYHVNRWDGFDKNDPNVLDGTSFMFNLKLDDNKTISASGYMKFPNNYHEVINELSDILEKDYDRSNYKWKD